MGVFHSMELRPTGLLGRCVVAAVCTLVCGLGVVPQWSLASAQPSNLAITVSTNQSAFEPGDTLTVSLVVDNPGDPRTVDFYFGAYLPNGGTAVLFTNQQLDFVAVESTDVASWPAIASSFSLSSPFTATRPEFFSYSWTGSERAGGYIFFLTAAVPGAFSDGTVDDGDIIATSTATLSFRHVSPSGEFLCTQVIGFSQTSNWYEAGTFEPIVGDAEWELLWQSGAAVQLWANPNYSGWNAKPRSECAQNSQNPDRVVLTISGSSGTDPSAWVTPIQNAVSTIRSKYENVRQIVLQPVVGGPNHTGLCPDAQGNNVRASEQHPAIWDAINQVVATADSDVVAGMDPHVRTCEDYQPDIGHIAPSARGAIGSGIGNFYLEFSGGGGNQLPIADIVADPTTGDTPLVVDFDGTGSVDLDGAIDSYHWDFGDGDTDTIALVSHIYDTAGSYTAVLTVTDNEGATDTDSVVINVTTPGANQPPVASFTASPTSGDEPLAVSFDASSSSDPDDGIVSYQWDFGDGATESGVTAQHTYLLAGSYTAVLTVADGKGAADSAQLTINVTSPGTNTPPDAVDDVIATPQGTRIILKPLANDTDADEDTLTITGVTQGANGSVVFRRTRVRYAPAGGFNGVDTFTYTISDGNGGVDTATVTVTVGSGGDPLSVVVSIPNDHASLLADTGDMSFASLAEQAWDPYSTSTESAYPTSDVSLRDGDGWYHKAWIWRVNGGLASTQHGVRYAKTKNYVDWYEADGLTPVPLPINVGEGHRVRGVGQNVGLQNIVRVSWDHENRPIVTYTRYDADGNSQVANWRYIGGAWRVSHPTAWTVHWDLDDPAPGTAIGFSGVIRTEDGRLAQRFSRAANDTTGTPASGFYYLDANLVPTTERYASPNPYGRPADWNVLEKTTTPDIKVRWQWLAGADNHAIKWESMPGNGNQARDCNGDGVVDAEPASNCSDVDAAFITKMYLYSYAQGAWHKFFIGYTWGGNHPGYAAIVSQNHVFIGYYNRFRALTVCSKTVNINFSAFNCKALDTKIKWDNHNNIVLATDNNGRIHVAGNMHANNLYYWMSTNGNPQNLQRAPMLGSEETSVTYPGFFRVGNGLGKLMFRYREGQSGDARWFMNTFNHNNDRWVRETSVPLFDNH